MDFAVTGGLNRSSSTQGDRWCFGVGRALGLLCTFVREERGRRRRILRTGSSVMML